MPDYVESPSLRTGPNAHHPAACLHDYRVRVAQVCQERRASRPEWTSYCGRNLSPQVDILNRSGVIKFCSAKKRLRPLAEPRNTSRQIARPIQTGIVCAFLVAPNTQLTLPRPSALEKWREGPVVAENTHPRHRSMAATHLRVLRAIDCVSSIDANAESSLRALRQIANAVTPKARAQLSSPADPSRRSECVATNRGSSQSPFAARTRRPESVY